MRLYIDLDSRNFLESPRFPRALTSLDLKRRDTDLLELQFIRDNTVQELPADASIRIGLKPAADYAGEFLATGTFTQSGTDTGTKYLLGLNLNTASINTAFSSTPTEPETLAAMLEVEWTTGGTISSSKTLALTIANDVIRGDEGEPVDLPLFYLSETSDLLATQAQAESGTDNTAWMSPLRTAQAIAALAGSGGVSSWDDLTAKPATFPPATHTHAVADVTNLQTALDGKAASTHTHTIAQVTGLQTELDALASGGGGGGVSSWDDLADKPATFPPSTHTHAASDITSGTLAIARIPTGTTSTSVCIGNDSRLSDARTPTAHTHGNLSNAGAIGTASGAPIITGTSGVLQAGAFGTTAGTFAEGNHSHAGYVTTSGGITAIAVVATMPTTPDANTLYIVTA